MLKLLFHFAGKPGNGAVVEPVGDRALLGFFQAFDRLLLLVEISRVLDFCFHRAQFIADLDRKMAVFRKLLITGLEESRKQFA